GRVPGVEGLSYRVYLVNGLRSAGFSAATGIREGRQEGREASFANPSFTGRLEWARPGLKLGGSFWYGGTAAADPALGKGAFAAPITLLSADARFDVSAFMFRGVAASIWVSDAAAINTRYPAGGRRASAARQARRLPCPAVRAARARRHAPRGQRRGAPDLHRGLAARLRPGGERHREGPADHVSRGDRPREPAEGRGHPGVPR